MEQNSLKYRRSASTAYQTLNKSQAMNTSYESRWKRTEDVPKLGPFADVYEAAKDHVHFT